MTAVPQGARDGPTSPTSNPEPEALQQKRVESERPTMTDIRSAIPAAPLVQLPANAITHPPCSQWWTGLGRSHCAVCCHTFSCDSAADRHRIGTFGVDRRCANPADVGLVARVKPYGDLWGWPSSDNYDPASRRESEEA